MNKIKINNRGSYDTSDIERLTGIPVDKIKEFIDNKTYEGFIICGVYMMNGANIKKMIALENMKGE